MRRMVLCISAALFAIAGLATPAMACRYSRPVFTAEQGRANAVKVRVERVLSIAEGRSPLAVRGTVLEDSAMARRGERIVIVVPTGMPENCYYFDFYDSSAITGDGALEGYVDLELAREPSGAFASVASPGRDRRQYDRFARGRLQGRWVRARFGIGQ
ncbi:MAG TPA: hypothetical protein VMS43_00100 [Allosphingosinicella sp.]|nr:hypothetical protein [Allosphingosinicella sp.]